MTNPIEVFRQTEPVGEGNNAIPKTRFVWRHQYETDADEYFGAISATVNEQPSKTQQHFKDDTDINIMMRRMGVKDGAIPPQAMDPRYFGTFTDEMDFRQALDAVRLAKERFETLPADIRDRFNHDPAKLFGFVNDPKNAEEAVKLGLLHKRAPAAKPEPIEVRVVTEPAPAAPAPPAP